MHQSTHSKYQSLSKRGLFRASESGLSQPTISRLVQEGLLYRVAPGLYIHPESHLPEQSIDYAVACKRFGQGVSIGGLTALFYYDLIEQVPNQIWLISNRRINSSRANGFYKILYSKAPSDQGIIAKKYYQITNIERTLAEGLRFSNLIGKRTIINATRMAISEKKTSLQKIGKMASLLNFRKSFLKYWESIDV